jgi:uncharacterized protein YbjT (DUF2867 family)
MNIMKIVVIGGTGLIGSTVVTRLREHGHEAVAASPDTGVNTITGEGLSDVLHAAQVVIDVSNSPSFEESAALQFFETGTTNLLAAAADAGVGHYVALSVVGTERLGASGYFRGKAAQEKLITSSSLPYSIVHATQFFEFVQTIAATATDGDTVRVPSALIQPMAAADVSGVVGRVSAGAPLNRVLEVGGPEQFRFADLLRTGLAARNDPRQVVEDHEATYFGYRLDERTLVPDDGAEIAPTTFATWLEQTAPASS